MTARVRVQGTDEERTGSFFVGEVISGILKPGMGAITPVGPIEVKRMTAGADVGKIRKRGLPTQRLYIHLAESLGPNRLQELVGEELEFTDQKTIPLKEAIFLRPEIG